MRYRPTLRSYSIFSFDVRMYCHFTIRANIHHFSTDGVSVDLTKILRWLSIPATGCDSIGHARAALVILASANAQTPSFYTPSFIEYRTAGSRYSCSWLPPLPLVQSLYLCALCAHLFLCTFDCRVCRLYHITSVYTYNSRSHSCPFPPRGLFPPSPTLIHSLERSEKDFINSEF